MTWKSDAPCKGLTTLFFSGDEFDILQAKSLCQTCPRKEECLEEAMSYHRDGLPLLGVWGGMTERERLHLSDAKPVGRNGPRVAAWRLEGRDKRTGPPRSA